MPTLNLSTNVPVDAVTSSDILKDCTRVLAKIIGKPESVSFKFIRHSTLSLYANELLLFTLWFYIRAAQIKKHLEIMRHLFILGSSSLANEAAACSLCLCGQCA